MRIWVVCKTQESTNTVYELNYYLYHTLKKAELPAAAVRELTHAFACNIWDNRLESAKTYYAHSKYGNFTDAVLSGCAREAESQKDQLPVDWVWDVMIALHFGERKQSIIAADDVKIITERMRSDPELRSRFFWATFDLSTALDGERDARDRYHFTVREGYLGGITEFDYPWLFKAVEDRSMPDRRGVAFYAVVLCWISKRDHATGSLIRRAISDLPDLVTEYDKFANPPKTSTHDKHQHESAKWKQKQERDEAIRIAEWDEWRLELEADPAAAFVGSAKEHNLYNFFTWMRMATSSHTSWGGWSEDTLRNTFSEALINQLKPALSGYWRKDDTKTWSEKEKKNSTSGRSINALSALKSETMVNGWADQLSTKEAQLATKLSMIELNGFADFLPTLARSHKVAVSYVITEELKVQIKNLSEVESVPLLDDLHYLDAPELKTAIAHWLIDALDLFPIEFNDGTSCRLPYDCERVY